MHINLSDTEIAWLQDNYPNLQIIHGTPMVIKGKLEFRGAPLELEEITDSYEIEVVMATRGRTTILPIVKETGGRITNSAAQWGKVNIADLHVNTADQTACLASWVEEEQKLPNGFNLIDFFNTFLIPYFYWQSYFEKYGREPWRGYSHGAIGLLESYNVLRQTEKAEKVTIHKTLSALETDKPIWTHLGKALQTKMDISYMPCLCGRGMDTFKVCHPMALDGFKKLRKDIIKQK